MNENKNIKLDSRIKYRDCILRSIKLKKLSHFEIIFDESLDNYNYCMYLCMLYESNDILNYLLKRFQPNIDDDMRKDEEIDKLKNN